jgi:outer membrane protein assembly factor BamB
MFGYGPAHTGFNPTESAISVGNVAGLVKRYPAGTTEGCGADAYQAEMCSSPAVAEGSVYLGAGSDLVARDPGSGSLRWSGHTGGPIWSSPAVVDGVVYVGSDDFKLYAFDAAGSTNCSGSPKICAPLWTARTAGKVRSSPTVANGVVYVGSDDHKLYAVSAAGTTNCSGSPKVCTALWTTTAVSGVGRTPAIGSGVVYVTGDQLYAFDAAGSTSCSGSPKVCTPLWTGTRGTGSATTSPAVADGVVYVGVEAGGAVLDGFSAAGTIRCSGSPKICGPIWSGDVWDPVTSAPAIANGVVYVTTDPHNVFKEGTLLAAFDAAGVTNCILAPGIPDWKACNPLWTAQAFGFWGSTSPVVARGVVYVTEQHGFDLGLDAEIRAFDATPAANCSGTANNCGDLWRDIIAFGFPPRVSSPVIANGAVYLNAGTVYQYALPG